jgi:hypothetical protein
MSTVEDEAVVAHDTTRQRSEQRGGDLNGVTAHFTYQVAHRRQPIGKFEQGSTVGEVDVADVAKFFQHIERAVDRAGADAGQEFDHAVGSDRAGLGREHIDHLATGFTDATISRAQHFDGLLLHAATSLPDFTLPATGSTKFVASRVIQSATGGEVIMTVDLQGLLAAR